MFWWGLRAKTNYVVELKSAAKFLNIYVDQFMKDELLFIPFMIFKKCSIPFMLNYSDLYVKFLCWENGVLQLVSEQVGPSGHVVESRCVVLQFCTVFELSCLLFVV